MITSTVRQQGAPAYKLTLTRGACLSPLLQLADSGICLVPLDDPGLMWPCSLQSYRLYGPAAYNRSDSSLELELRCVPKATVLGSEGGEWCVVEWLKGTCESSYWGSSPSDGSSPSKRYGGGGRSNQGGRLGEKTEGSQGHELLHKDGIMKTFFDWKQRWAWAQDDISDTITQLYSNNCRRAVI